MNTFTVGDRVRAKIDLDSDDRDQGMGIQRYASRGDELIVRGLREGSRWISVAHEEITGRSFLVEPDEIEVVIAAKDCT